MGTDLTLDELMIAWKGKKGNGGIPHLSFVEHKPIPLGTEAKVVCEGSMGMCVYIELQKGKMLWRGKNGAASIKQQLLVPSVCQTKWARKNWKMYRQLHVG